MSPQSKPQLYIFNGSVWSTAPRLAIQELGYDLDNGFDVQTLVLLHGENFKPEYLKLAKNGTVPALVDLQGEVLDSTLVRLSSFPLRSVLDDAMTNFLGMGVS